MPLTDFLKSILNSWKKIPESNIATVCAIYDSDIARKVKNT